MQVYKRKEYTQVYNVIILLQEYFPIIMKEGNVCMWYRASRQRKRPYTAPIPTEALK